VLVLTREVAIALKMEKTVNVEIVTMQATQQALADVMIRRIANVLKMERIVNAEIAL